ncbi:hypothetical protein MSAN_02386400 [Mycena sanguinolenta]|uniref:Uncharacterized protein n=1 Tax=Mycena sanguinolenta TaxID=230812 RepID=A0A8H6X511_9AGAR|nr:hypothetical protein MSAN_02386400 [Mycena sanguinolenta]
MSYPWLAQAAHNKVAIREGLKIVRKVVARDAVKTPLSTADLYKLVLREAPPPTFASTIPEDDDSVHAIKYGKSGRRRIPATAPPHPRHPVRSMSFLKRTILPIMVGERCIRHVREKRLVMQSKADLKGRSVRGGAKQQAASSASTQPVEALIWLWQASKPPPRVEKPAPPPSPDVYDFSHMKASKRKVRRQRLELAEKRADLRARRETLKVETRRKAEREVLAAKRLEGRLRHQAEEKAALARKAERRKRWEASNPILAKALAKQQAEAAQRLAPVISPSKKLRA